MQIRAAKPDDALSIITHISNVYGWDTHLKQGRWKNWEKKISNESSYYRILEDKNDLIGI